MAYVVLFLLLLLFSRYLGSAGVVSMVAVDIIFVPLRFLSAQGG